MTRPIVSAVMPNYNDAATIGEAVEALLGQSFKSLEVIVVDDASTDNSVEVVEVIAKRDARVRLIRHEHNRGPIHAQLAAFKIVEGDYIYSTSANDKVLPGFFEKLVRCLERHSEAGVGFSDLVCLDNPDYSSIAAISKAPTYFAPESLMGILRERHRFTLGGGASLIRRSALKEVGWFVPELRWMADFFALYVIGFRYGLCHVPEPLYAIRTPAYSKSSTMNFAQREAILHMLKLLKSAPFRDVLPYFNQTGILAVIPQFLATVIHHPAHWDVLSPILLRRALWNETKNALRPVTPIRFRQAYRKIRNRCIAGQALHVRNH